jgi:hypothetical protein
MDNAKIQVERVPRPDGPVTGFTYIDDGQMAHFRAREDRLTFQMTAAQAAAAIATGGFAVAPDSKSEAQEETVTLDEIPRGVTFSVAPAEEQEKE